MLKDSRNQPRVGMTRLAAELIFVVPDLGLRDHYDSIPGSPASNLILK